MGIAGVPKENPLYIRVAEFYALDGSTFHASVGLKIPADSKPFRTGTWAHLEGRDTVVVLVWILPHKKKVLN